MLLLLSLEWYFRSKAERQKTAGSSFISLANSYLSIPVGSIIILFSDLFFFLSTVLSHCLFSSAPKPPPLASKTNFAGFAVSLSLYFSLTHTGEVSAKDIKEPTEDSAKAL